MAGRLWEVIGGADKGGILVRVGQEKTSDQAPERLSRGAKVKELELVGERLHYARLTGSGPDSGWASLKLQDGKLLMVEAPPLRMWDVVGGAEKGGIVVRIGQELESPQAPDRLATGARVRELELVGERLFYDKLTGAGPQTGWVSLKFKDTALLSEVLLQLPTEVNPIAGRKVRILGLPSGPGNSNLMKFQTMQLQQVFGDLAEWFFLEPPTPWEPVLGSTHPAETERSEFEVKIAKDKPFTQWYSYSYHMRPFDEGDSDGWEHVPECCDYIMEYMEKIGPVDVVVAFSASGCMVGMLIEMLRRKGEKPPWRLNVFFCGSNIDDHRYQFEEPCSLPTLYMTGGDKDSLYRWSLMLVRKMYSNLRVLGHDDGHVLPTTRPRATEIYSQIAVEVKRHCGLGVKP